MTACTSRFQKIDGKLAEHIVTRFGSPVYIMDESGIRARLAEIRQQTRSVYANSVVAVPYKTSTIHGLLALLHRDGAWAEVVSGDEYRVARALGVPDERIIFNGPMKTDQQLAEAMLSGAQINCDHAGEVDRLEDIARAHNTVARVGIRLSFPDVRGWNRFGFSVRGGNAGGAADISGRIFASRHLELQGVHAQIGTNIRDLSRFTVMAEKMAAFAVHLQKTHGIELKYINVGGGLAGISPRIDEAGPGPWPLPGVKAYARAVISPLLPYLKGLSREATLIFEPGRTLFEPFGAMLTTVIGLRPAGPDGIPGVILDAGRSNLVLASEYAHPIHVCGRTRPERRQKLFGPTCMERDVLHSPSVLPVLKRNDRLVIYGCGGYSMSRAGSFIRFRSGVLLWRDNGDMLWLREPETLSHQKMLEHIPEERQ